MKKPVTLLFILLFSLTTSFSQSFTHETNQLYGTDSETLTGKDHERSMEFWVLPFSGAGSPATRIPGNTWRYQRTQYLIAASEIAATGFPADFTIDAIGFSILDAGVGTQTGNLKIYMKNTSDVAYSLDDNWDIEGFTLVSDDDSFTVPIEAGPYAIPFSGGSPFVYTGEGVYVAFEFSNPSGTLGSEALTARCNDTMNNGLRGNRNNSTMPTFLVASAWRPATKFINNSIVNIAEITNIYTLEKVAVGAGSPAPIDVRVINVSAEAATFDVTVTVEDMSNTTTYYTHTLPVTDLEAGGATIISFPGWNPTVIEDVIITAETSEIPGETWTVNNTLSIPVNVNNDILSYTFNNEDPLSFGYNHPHSGLFLSKYKMNGTGSVNGANLVISNSATVPGNTIYAVVLNSSGAIVNQSGHYVIQAGDLGSTLAFSFPEPPEFTDEDFYVGLAQLAGSASFFPLGRFVENPQRQNTFFAAPISGGDLNEIEDFFNLKFGIEAIVEGSVVNTIVLTSGEGTDDQEVCINTPIDDITYATTGATGATVTGLPGGVSGEWSDNVVVISGTPTEAGSFDYTITLTGGEGEVTAQGSITVNPGNTIALTSGEGTDNQEVSLNTAIDDITYATTGATGATVTGLPDGVSGSWSDDVVSISGTPTEAGSFDFTITLTGGCGEVTAQGTITVIDESLSVTDHQDGDFVIYPNPVSNMLTLEIFATEASQHTWSIYDTKGKSVLSGTNTLVPGKNAFTINMETFPSGLYMLQSNVNGRIKSLRIVRK